MRAGRRLSAALMALALVLSFVGVANASPVERVPAPAVGECVRTYVVRPGDGWYLIASKSYPGVLRSVALAQLLAANNATTSTPLYAGRTICLERSTTTTTTAPTTTSPSSSTTSSTSSTTSSTTSTTAAAPIGGLGAGGEYIALTPTTIAPKTTRRLNTTFDLDLLGRAGIPSASADVLAVMVAVTVSAPTKSGWLGVYPAGSPPAQPSSALNFSAWRNATNTVLVRPGANGRFTVRLVAATAGTAQVSVDVLGWIASSSSAVRGGRLQLQNPVTVYNSLDGTGRNGVKSAILSGRSTQVVVPGAAGATAALLNISALRPSAATSLSVLPASTTRTPTVVSLSATAGQSRAALVLVPLGAGGSVWLRHTSGSTHVAVEVVGFVRSVPDDSRAGRIVPLSAPFRAFDTREAAFGNIALGPGQSERWSFSDFASSVAIGGISVGRQAGLLGTITAAGSAGQTTSRLSVSTDSIPTGQVPASAQLYTVTGQAVANMVAVRYDAQTSAWTFNQAGQTHYLLDATAVVLAD